MWLKLLTFVNTHDEVHVPKENSAELIILTWN